MGKNRKEGRYFAADADYEASLRKLQIELVKLERHVIKHRHKVLVIFEGRDAGGKGGTIKRIVEHLSPRETRVVALGKPSERDNTSWYFQRYVAHLPAAQEMVLFNRSWYNRAGVARVMGFCTEKEYETFIEAVLRFARDEMFARTSSPLAPWVRPWNENADLPVHAPKDPAATS